MEEHAEPPAKSSWGAFLLHARHTGADADLRCPPTSSMPGWNSGKQWSTLQDFGQTKTRMCYLCPRSKALPMCPVAQACDVPQAAPRLLAGRDERAAVPGMRGAPPSEDIEPGRPAWDRPGPKGKGTRVFRRSFAARPQGSVNCRSTCETRADADARPSGRSPRPPSIESTPR